VFGQAKVLTMLRSSTEKREHNKKLSKREENFKEARPINAAFKSFLAVFGRR
jgi:hypothetical protein